MHLPASNHRQGEGEIAREMLRWGEGRMGGGGTDWRHVQVVTLSVWGERKGHRGQG